MDKERILELAPHYLVMMVLVFLILGIARQIIGSFGFWVELGIIVVVVFSYRPIVLRLGVAPSSWEESR